MQQFWNGFEKRALDVGRVRGLASKGRHTPPPIPGMRPSPSTPQRIPGHGAVAVSKNLSIKPITQQSRGVPETAT